jgi:hypothetical protein
MFILTTFFYSTLVFAAPTWNESIKNDLTELYENPVKALNKVPTKSSSHNRFSSEAIKGRRYVEMKEGCRQTQQVIKSPWRRNDRPEALVDNGLSIVKKLSDFENLKLLQGQAKTIPWSDSYWPMAEGTLSQRYQDPEWPYGTWKEMRDYAFKNSSSSLVKASKLDILSPAEKYDLLLNDSKFTLFHSMWKEGELYWNEYGEVETWMGLCHGWATASFMLPEPLVGITISNGQEKIPFTVSDLKGLGTNLYAKGEIETKFVGGRCSTKDPTVDENGRVIEDDCVDTNPGTWHLVVVNQLGISKRPFIFDATYDYQVWNQPAFKYKYQYFNPLTKEPTTDLKSAQILLTDFKTDLFKTYRSSKAKFVVGISMQITYGVENSPSPENHQPALSRTVHYLYDLELNENEEIIGGEWYNNNHPDFLWVPALNAEIQTPGDQYLGTQGWRDHHDTNSEIMRASQYNAKNGMVLNLIVKELFKKAQPSIDEGP